MSQRLLIVDDELHILKAAEFKFKRQGFDVDCARDGVHGWEMMQRKRPDLVITDLQMPRMNGLELIQQMQDDERFRDIPTILLTAKGYELDRDDITTRLGVYEIVFKPFSPRDLCKCVVEALAQCKDKPPHAEPATAATPAGFVTGQAGAESQSTTTLNCEADTT